MENKKKLLKNLVSFRWFYNLFNNSFGGENVLLKSHIQEKKYANNRKKCTRSPVITYQLNRAGFMSVSE